MNQVLFVVSGHPDVTSLFINTLVGMAEHKVAVVTPDSLRRQDPEWDYAPITAVHTQQLSEAQADNTAIRLHKSLQRQLKQGLVRRGLLLTCEDPLALKALDKMRRDRLYLHVHIERIDASQSMAVTVFKEDVRVAYGETHYFPAMMKQLTNYLLMQLPAHNRGAEALPDDSLSP